MVADRVLSGARVFAFGLAITTVLAGQAIGANERGTFSFVLENDVFYNLDRDYTNGVQIAWTSAPVVGSCWACDVAGVFPFFDDSGEMRVNYALGQSMFTPSDISNVNPPLTDRPYARWLYGAIGVISKKDYDSTGHGPVVTPRSAAAFARRCRPFVAGGRSSEIRSQDHRLHRTDGLGYTIEGPAGAAAHL